MSRRASAGGLTGVRADVAQHHPDDAYAANTKAHSGPVELPSDRFTAGGRRTLTLEEWRRAHTRTYPPADELDTPA